MSPLSLATDFDERRIHDSLSPTSRSDFIAPPFAPENHRPNTIRSETELQITDTTTVSPSTIRDTVQSYRMGQGASTPRDEARNVAGSNGQQQQHNQPLNGRDAVEMMEAGGPGITREETEDRATMAARLRRSRRLRNHLDHLSRIGNRFMPSTNSSASSLASGNSATRTRIPGLRFRRRTGRTGHSGSRSPSPPRGILRNDVASIRRRTLPPISNPIPMDTDVPEMGGGDIDMMDIPNAPLALPAVLQSREPIDPTRRSRISRVRNSISSWPGLMSQELGSMISSRRQSTTLNREDGMDIDTLSTPLTSSMTDRRPSMSRNADSIRDSPTGGNRSDPASIFGNALDGFDNPTRVRPGEDQAAMLSRLLSVAAETTAASLVGNQQRAISEARDVGGNHQGEDGSFEAFLRALQNGRLEAALSNGGNELGGGAPAADSQSENGNMLSLNFFRMFRFGSQPAPLNAQGESAGRMVPVIIVGIRSVTPRDSGDPADERTTPFLDALTANIPMPMPGSATERSRFRNGTRRASMGDVEPPLFPRQRRNADSQSSGDDTPITDDLPMGLSTIQDDNNEEDPLETYRSRHESLRRRFPRRLSTPDPPDISRPSSDSRTTAEGTPRARDGRQRSTPSNMEGTRSWIIYVLGGSYPENHPILTTPSLFTDVSCITFANVTCTNFLEGTHIRGHDPSLFSSGTRKATSCQS